jgi:RNA polymerase sigma factor (TIGR02999 family)
MPEKPGDITVLLQKWRSGSSTAENKLFALVLPDLQRLAHYYMKGERQGHTLQPTALVNEAFIRLVAAKDRDWQNRQHFYAIAARCMRRYLIDYARGRPDAVFVPAEGAENLFPAKSINVDTAVTIDRLLDELVELHPDWCKLVELKYFLGLTDQETAEMMDLTLRTMQRTWRDARQWLFERMEPRDANQSAGR